MNFVGQKHIVWILHFMVNDWSAWI